MDDRIGEITDVVMDREGVVRGIVVGVGGFLGIDEHHVAIAFDTVRVVRDSERPEQAFFVVNTTREAPGAIPAHRRGASVAAAPAATTGMVTIGGIEHPCCAARS